MATDETTKLDRIEATPDVCGGDARIRGRRIPVWQLVAARRARLSDREILHSFVPPLASEDLEAAWSYHEDHPAEIDEAIRDNEEG